MNQDVSKDPAKLVVQASVPPGLPGPYSLVVACREVVDLGDQPSALQKSGQWCSHFRRPGDRRAVFSRCFPCRCSSQAGTEPLVSMGRDLERESGFPVSTQSLRLWADP